MPKPEQLVHVTNAVTAATEEVRNNLALAGPKNGIRIERFVAVKFRGQQTNHIDIPFDGDTFTLDTFKAVTSAFEKQ